MDSLEHRSSSLLKALSKTLWPTLKFIFRFKHSPKKIDWPQAPLLLISNHNSGALVESHSLLFLALERGLTLYGFTHPSLFKVPIFKQYFEKIGAVPAAVAHPSPRVTP